MVSAKIPDVFACLMTVLRAGSSAPGLDGTPYEAWQVLPQLLSRILHQWFWDALNRPHKASLELRYIIDLIKRIVRVSIESVKIVNSLPPLNER